MKATLFFISLVLLIAIQPARAQQPPPQDPFGDSLFPPELVMQHQEEIGLTEEQKNFLKTESRKAALRFTELQWQLSDAAEKMAAVVKQPKVDEHQAIAMLDQVLDAEREIKRLQISLVIRIKNNLTPEQQARLQDIKNKARSK
ncbi:MAG TPA: periplasmic heavy metal sensor [Blastocatellia bacterium]|jgi:Spy/CpxP family protein refolding chaperone|nr:periplasmic heavy metal sensor [Blastocatellia bacterium]